ncbi:hypothetical protein Avbf_00388 [Armadillidium vulgare]|nr:hypothetical protein Avbf_00388 [Armadillidium vulgare]
MKMQLLGAVLLGVLLSMVLCQAEDDKSANLRRQRLIIGKKSVKTHVSLTTITTLVPTTCQIGINTSPCKKRRRRKRSQVLITDDQNTLQNEEDLSPSSEIGKSDKEVVTSNRDGRVKIVFWSTVTSAYTITSTSINTGVTFSVSFLLFCWRSYLPRNVG